MRRPATMTVRVSANSRLSTEGVCLHYPCIPATFAQCVCPCVVQGCFSELARMSIANAGSSVGRYEEGALSCLAHTVEPHPVHYTGSWRGRAHHQTRGPLVSSNGPGVCGHVSWYGAVGDVASRRPTASKCRHSAALLFWPSA